MLLKIEYTLANKLNYQVHDRTPVRKALYFFRQYQKDAEEAARAQRAAAQRQAGRRPRG